MIGYTHALLTVQYCYACRCAQNQFPQIMHMKLRWSEWWNICEICYMLRHFVSNIWDLKKYFSRFFIYERFELWPTRLKRLSVLKAAYWIKMANLTDLWQFDNCQVTAWHLPDNYLTTAWILPENCPITNSLNLIFKVYFVVNE